MYASVTNIRIPPEMGAEVSGGARGPVEDTDSLAAMGLGINFIDTADVYGDGRSESLVADDLRLIREVPPL